MQALATLRMSAGGDGNLSPAADDGEELVVAHGTEKSAWMQCVTLEGYLYYYNVCGCVRARVCAHAHMHVYTHAACLNPSSRVHTRVYICIEH